MNHEPSEGEPSLGGPRSILLAPPVRSSGLGASLAEGARARGGARARVERGGHDAASRDAEALPTSAPETWGQEGMFPAQEGGGVSLERAPRARMRAFWVLEVGEEEGAGGGRCGGERGKSVLRRQTRAVCRAIDLCEVGERRRAASRSNSARHT